MLRRIASEISGKLDLQSVFESVLDDTAALFRNELSGLWLTQAGPNPLDLAAHRGLSQQCATPSRGSPDKRHAGTAGAPRAAIRVSGPDQATSRLIAGDIGWRQSITG